MDALELKDIEQWVNKSLTIFKRLKETYQWVGRLKAFNDVTTKPPEALNYVVFSVASEMSAVVCLTAMFWAMGLNVLNIPRTNSNYKDIGDFIGGYVSEVKFILMHSVFGRFELTREAATVLLSGAISLTVFGAVTLLSAWKKSPHATLKQRVEFASYQVAGFMCRYIIAVVACTAILLFLRVLAGGLWQQRHALEIAFGSLAGTFLATAASFWRSQKKKQTLGSTSKDWESPLFASMVAAVGTGAIVLWIASLMAEAFSPKLTLTMSDACGAHGVGSCTVYVRSEHLPGVIVLDRIRFNFSVVYMIGDKEVPGSQAGADGSIFVTTSSDDKSPLSVDGAAESKGIVATTSFTCPPPTPKTIGSKILVKTYHAYAYARISDAQGPNERQPIDVSFEPPFIALLFRDSVRDCIFFP